MPDDRGTSHTGSLHTILISITTSSETDFLGQVACGTDIQMLRQKNSLHSSYVKSISSPSVQALVVE